MEVLFVFKVFRKWRWYVIYCDQYVSLVIYIYSQRCLRHYLAQTWTHRTNASADTRNHDSFVYCQLFLIFTSNFLKRTVPGFENHIPLISFDRSIDWLIITLFNDVIPTLEVMWCRLVLENGREWWVNKKLSRRYYRCICLTDWENHDKYAAR